MKILLTDGSHANTLGIMRHLKGHEIDIIHHKKSAPAYSRYCNKLIISPKITQRDAYALFLYHHVRANHYDILIPVGALACYICSEHHDSLSLYVRIEVAAFEYFNTAIDKVETFKFCEQHGILHPKTYHDPKLLNVKYPVIIKARGEVKGKFPVKYINNQDELWEQIDSILNDHPHLKIEDLVIQERIVGENYGFLCLYQDGVIKRAICHKRLREYPATGGPATSAEIVYDEKLIALGKNVYDKLYWNGVGMVEYIKQDGEYYLIEINPKFWTTIEMHILAGMHFPEYLLEMDKHHLHYRDDYKKIRFVWLFAWVGELYRLFQRPGDILKVIRDLFRSKNDLYLNDLKPTIVQLLYWVIWIFKK